MTIDDDDDAVLLMQTNQVTITMPLRQDDAALPRCSRSRCTNDSRSTTSTAAARLSPNHLMRPQLVSMLHCHLIAATDSLTHKLAQVYRLIENSNQ